MGTDALHQSRTTGQLHLFPERVCAAHRKEKDEEKAQRLQAIVKPFILRRTKDQVATELPPKTEQVLYCEMTEKQSELYEKVKSEYRNAILDGQLDSKPKSTQIALLQRLDKAPTISQSSQNGG